MVIAFVLLQARTMRDLRSPRFYAPVIPHIVMAIAFLGVHQWVREHNAYQQAAFSFSRHMIPTYLGFLAYAGSPFDPTADVFLRWRAVLPGLGIAAATLWLLVSRGFDLRLRVLIIAWFLLAIVPLSTFTLGIQSRKLYVAGAPFALLLAMSAVSLWDWLSPRLRPFSLNALDVRYAGLAAAAVLVAVALPLRTWQVIDRPHMAEASLTDLDDQDYKVMIDQIRQTHPTIPDGARLELTGVPWTLLIFKVLDTRMSDAVLLYYNVHVIGYPNAESLASNPVPHDYVVHFTCPPICGPPLPLEWIQAIQENKGNAPTDP
jgi:hypothetical protein